MPHFVTRLRAAWMRVVGLGSRRSDEARMHEEMAFHLERLAERYTKEGMPAGEARRRAAIDFGGRAGHEEGARDALRSRVVENLLRDIQLAVRSLRNTPRFALTTIVTIALGVAAAVTAFGFTDVVFLRPLDVPRADRLVRVYLPRSARDGLRVGIASVGTWGAALLRTQTRVFEDVAADADRNVLFVRARGALEQSYPSWVSANYFTMLGVRPQLGRFFSPEENAVPDRDAVTVISSAVWHSRFDGDRHVIGEHVAIDGRDFTVIGVAPDGFDGTGVGETPTQFWLPTMVAGITGSSCARQPPCQDADVLARLAPGVGIAAARAAVGVLGRQLSHLAFGDDSLRTPIVVPATGILWPQQRHYSGLARLLAAIAGVMLLIACTNLGGLLVVRGVARRRAVAMRFALGASRWRVVQQLLAESAVIGLAGGALGVLLSVWTSRALMGFFVTDEEGFPHFFRLGLNTNILGFAVGVALVATAIFGVLPALATTRVAPADVLKNTGGGAPRGGARFGLITAQVAMASMLLCAAVLLSRSFSHLLYSERFDPRHVALFRVRPAAVAYTPERAQRYVHDVAARVAALPGIEAVAYAKGSGLLWSSTPWTAGIGTAPGDSATIVETHSVSPGFLAALSIPLVAGREFDERDDSSAPRIAVLNASLAERLSPGGSLVGRNVYLHGTPFRVVGVAADYRVRLLGEAAPLVVFVPFRQNALGPELDARFAIRVHGDPAAVLATLRRTAAGVDPNVPVAEEMTMTEQIDANYPTIRLGKAITVAAGSIALVLSAIGIFGLVAFIVERQSREIGIRVALGATSRGVVWHFARRGLRAATLGTALGVAGATLASPFLREWLVDVTPRDSVAFAVAAVATLGVALLASIWPARRAARVDPTVTLRVE